MIKFYAMKRWDGRGMFRSSVLVTKDSVPFGAIVSNKYSMKIFHRFAENYPKAKFSFSPKKKTTAWGDVVTCNWDEENKTYCDCLAEFRKWEAENNAEEFNGYWNNSMFAENSGIGAYKNISELKKEIKRNF